MNSVILNSYEFDLEMKDTLHSAEMIDAKFTELCDMRDHIAKFGIDSTFLNIYNKNGELSELYGFQFPACENLHESPESGLSQICLEGFASDVWTKIKEFILKIWEKIVDWFRKLFKMGEKLSDMKAKVNFPVKTLDRVKLEDFRKKVDEKIADKLTNTSFLNQQLANMKPLKLKREIVDFKDLIAGLSKGIDGTEKFVNRFEELVGKKIKEAVITGITFASGLPEEKLVVAFETEEPLNNYPAGNVAVPGFFTDEEVSGFNLQKVDSYMQSLSEAVSEGDALEKFIAEANKKVSALQSKVKRWDFALKITMTGDAAQLMRRVHKACLTWLGKIASDLSKAMRLFGMYCEEMVRLDKARCHAILTPCLTDLPKLGR